MSTTPQEGEGKKHTQKRRRFLVHNNKKYRIHSTASDKEIYKNLIKIIRHLLPKKRARKGKAGSKSKIPFSHPTITGGSITTEAAIKKIFEKQQENKLQLLKEENKLDLANKKSESTELVELRNKVQDVDNWILQMEKFMQSQYEREVQQQQLLLATQAPPPLLTSESEEQEEVVPKTPASKKKRTPYKGSREVKPILNEVPLPPRRAKTEPGFYSKNAGAGISNSSPGLYNVEVSKLMSRFKSRGFLGVYSIDQLDAIEPPANKNQISFIMNTVPHDVKWGHIVAVLIDKGRDTLEYFDSFGEQPPAIFRRNIRALLDKMGMKSPVQLKVNLVRLQRVNSSTCGPYAISFLIKRYNGKSWKEASGFDKFVSILKEEKKMRAFMQHIKEFGSI